MFLLEQNSQGSNLSCGIKIYFKHFILAIIMDIVYLQTGLEESPPTEFVAIHKNIVLYKQVTWLI